MEPRTKELLLRLKARYQNQEEMLFRIKDALRKSINEIEEEVSRDGDSD